MSQSLLAIIGGGNMASAIVRGALRAGVLAAGEMVIADPDASKRVVFEELGIRAVPEAAELAPFLGAISQILLAVKPQSLSEVARDAGSLGANGRVLITILAGTPSAKVAAAFPGARVIRAMPNLPAQLGQGCTAIALGHNAQPGDDAFALRLFGALGPVVVRIEEELMDAFTAIAGSGPAYLFYLAEAMTRAAESLGFSAEVASTIVRQTIAGSAALLTHSPEKTAVELRAAVTSKGGTTAAATTVLDEAQVMHVFIRALTAARDRGREMGEAPPGRRG